MSAEWVAIALDVGFWSVLSLVAASMLVVVIGPSNVDRLVATDIALVLITVALGLFSARQTSSFYMDAALVIAVVSFLVTVVVARQLESGRVYA